MTGLSLDRILTAAVNSMIHGKRAPHCYSAHLPGKGYVNDGTNPATRAEYLRQLERDARQEVENMAWSSTYAEPGYDDPERGILFANWNNLPRDLDDILERAGYAIEWGDEWALCSGCGAALRTVPDSFCWTPQYRDSDIEQGEIVCKDCQDDDEPGDETTT